jgi:hypothetical protein
VQWLIQALRRLRLGEPSIANSSVFNGVEGERGVFDFAPGYFPAKGMQSRRSAHSTSSGQVTEPLSQWGKGDRKGLEIMLRPVYDELRCCERHHLNGERPNHTLQDALQRPYSDPMLIQRNPE